MARRPIRCTLLLLLAGAFLVPGRIWCQYAPARLDSVVRLLDPSVKDTHQLELLQLAADSWFTSPNAQPYLARLDSLSAELLRSPHPAIARKALRARGAFHYYTGYHAKFTRNVPLALRSFKAALDALERTDDRHGQAEAHDALGVLLRAAGDPLQAIAAFGHERVLARALDDRHLEVQALVHLAACHADRDDLSRAHAYLDSCTGGSNAERSAVLNERARLLELQGRSREALDTLEWSLALAAHTGNEWDKLPVLAPLARLHYRAGRMREGLQAALACADVARRMGDLTAQCGCLVLAGRGKHAQGDAREAERDLREAMRLAILTGNIGAARELGDEGSLVEATALLKGILKEQGRDREALAMTELWAALKDSVQRMNGRDEIMTFEFQKELLRDSLVHAEHVEREQREGEQRLARERGRRNVIALLGLLVLVAALAIWGRLRLVRRTNRRILEAQHQLLESERQREAEQVRVRIARDVHDEIGGELTKITLLGRKAHRQLAEEPEAVAESVDRIRELSRRLGGTLSDIVWAVDPQRDTVQSLVDHARAVARQLLDGTSITAELHFVHTGPDHTIEPAVRRDILLVLKEAMNNALKHADASLITISLRTDAGRFELRVADNGMGGGAGEPSSGNGIRNMRERAQRLGARLTCTTMPGGGHEVVLAGPLPWIAPQAHTTQRVLPSRDRISFLRSLVRWVWDSAGL